MVSVVVGRVIWLWLEAVVLGLLIPDRFSVPLAERIGRAIARVEHQKYWWIPVGGPALIAGIIAFFSSIQINWNGFLAALGLLVLGGIWISSFFLSRRKKRQEAQEEVQTEGEAS